MAIKVSQSIIDEFRSGGMSAAIKKYKAGEGTPEFNEAIKRYYPGAVKEISNPGNNGPKVESTYQAPAKITTKNKFITTTEDTPGWKPGMTAADKQKNMQVIKRAAKKRSGDIGSSKGPGEFASRLGRNIGSLFQEKKSAPSREQRAATAAVKKIDAAKKKVVSKTSKKVAL